VEPTTTVVQFTATTDLAGLSASEVDAGVLSAFQQLTADTLGTDADSVNITSVTDTSTRRRHLLGGASSRSLAGKGVKIEFVILFILEKTSTPSNATAVVVSYETLLANKFLSSTVGSELITLALSSGSTTVTSSTVVTLTAPTVDRSYIVIIVKTGAPTAVPAERGADDDSAADMTPIIIGVAVGGGVLLLLLVAALYFFTGKGTGKIEPR
jgi:hypothetical protein